MFGTLTEVIADWPLTAEYTPRPGSSAAVQLPCVTRAHPHRTLPRRPRRRRSADEFIAETVDGQDVLGGFRIVDFLPQSGHVHVDGPRHRHLVVAPHVSQQGVARQRRAAMFDEMAQQLEFACRQLARRPAARHFHAAHIHDHVAEPVGRTAGLGARYAAPQQRLEPGHELDRLERLGQVVVRTKLQADDFVDDLPPRRQHQDRRRYPTLPDRAAHVEAVHQRQHDIEHDEVVAARRDALEARFTVACGLDAIAFAAEAIAQRQAQPRFVFDEEHTGSDAHQAADSGARAAPAASGSAAAGKWMTTVVPSATRLSTEIAPWCASITCLTTLRPMPVPRTCASMARRPR